MNLKLTPAAELKILSEGNRLFFEEEALKSKAYKRLLHKIGESALRGHFSVQFSLFNDEDVRLIDVFKKQLKSEGYHTRPAALLSLRSIVVSWHYPNKNT